MESKQNSESKVKDVEFKIEEIISVTSGITIRGVDFFDNYGKISGAFSSSSDYKYDDQKSLAENIYTAFPQYKLKEITEKFKTTVKSWKEQNQDQTFINNATNATIVTMAVNAGIPKKLTLSVNEKSESKTRDNAPIAGQDSFGYYDFKDKTNEQSAKPTVQTLDSILAEKMGIRGGRP